MNYLFSCLFTGDLKAALDWPSSSADSGISSSVHIASNGPTSGAVSEGTPVSSISDTHQLLIRGCRPSSVPSTKKFSDETVVATSSPPAAPSPVVSYYSGKNLK